MVWRKLHAIWRNQGSHHTIAPHKNTWKRLQSTVCWCKLKLASRERIPILPDTVTCSRSLQHTACSLHWESGMYENSGGALQEGSLNSKNATGCTQIELAIRSTRSTIPRRKIILGTIERFGKLQGNLFQHCGLQNFWSTSFISRAAGCNMWEQGQEVNWEVREPQHKDPFLQDLSQTQKMAGIDRRHEQHRYLRTLRKFFQSAMSWLQYQLGNGNNLLQLWKKYEICSESNGVRPEQPWRHPNPWLRH